MKKNAYRCLIAASMILLQPNVIGYAAVPTITENASAVSTVAEDNQQTESIENEDQNENQNAEEKNYAKYKVDKDRLFQTVEMKDDEGKTVGTLLERVDEEYRHWKIEHDNHAYAEELANDLCEMSTENEEMFNAYMSDKRLKDKDVYNLSMVLCDDLNSKNVDSILDVLNEKIQEEQNILHKSEDTKDSPHLEKIKENLQRLEQHISAIKEQYMEQNLDIFEEMDEALIKYILDDDEKNVTYENIDPKNLKINKEKEMQKEKNIDKKNT